MSVTRKRQRIIAPAGEHIPLKLHRTNLIAAVKSPQPLPGSTCTSSTAEISEHIVSPFAKQTLEDRTIPDLTSIEPTLLTTIREIVSDKPFHWEILDWEIFAHGGIVHRYVSKLPREIIQGLFSNRMKSNKWATGCVFFYPKAQPSGADRGAWIITRSDSKLQPANAIADVEYSAIKPSCKGEWRERSCRKNCRTFVNWQIGLRAWFDITRQNMLFLNCEKTSKRKQHNALKSSHI